MPDTPSITIVKRFQYRGQDEEFSNTYHFSGTTPADAAAWKTLADGIIAIEKLTQNSQTKFVRAYGYVAGTEHSVAQIDYTVPPNTLLSGTGTFTGGSLAPGDAAVNIRWLTPDLNSRGKHIYCRKYMHNVYVETAVPDLVLDSQKTAFQTFAGKMIDGTLPGGVKYCGPQGAVLSSPRVDQYITTRTLKRRGKRPLASG